MKPCFRCKERPRYRKHCSFCRECNKAYNRSRYKRAGDKDFVSKPCVKCQTGSTYISCSSYCKDCALKVNKSRYSKNKSDPNSTYNLFYRLINELKSVPCADCGSKHHPYVMDFDHLPQFEKKFNVSSKFDRPLEEVKAEAAKCDVVCSNCHRMRTLKRKSS